MPVLFSYLLKISIGLAVVYLFYRLVLRNTTFYATNRWYLLGYSAICFLIPLINISSLFRKENLESLELIQWIPTIQQQPSTVHMEETAPVITLWGVAGILFMAGIIVMLFRLVLQLLSFRKMISQARLISDKGVKVYQLNERVIPFSFGKSIFINPRLHDEQELQEIMRHEFVHVKQVHTIDIIWSEFLCMLNWYNPFAWLIRSAIRQNLEFIADDQVLQNGINKKQYQYLLLKVIGNTQFSIANQFNFSSLKKRIAMMNKLKTARVHALRFLLILPVLAVLVLAFRSNQSTAQVAGAISDVPLQQSFNDTVPDPKKPNDKGYFIRVDDNKGHCMIVVKDKNHQEVKRMLLTEWNDRADYFNSVYGEIPPVTPAAPPVIVADNQDMQQFLERNPSVKDIHWSISNSNNNGSKTNVIKARIEKKDGTVENLDLSDPIALAKFEKKYGRFPDVSAPPAPPIPVIAPAPPLPPTIAPVAAMAPPPTISAIPPVPTVPAAPPAMIAPVPPAPPLPSVPDSIAWYTSDGVLELRGKKLTASMNKQAELLVHKVRVKEGSPVVFIDGRELLPGKEFNTVQKMKIRVRMMGTQDAVKKYGDKGRKGAIEIYSIQAHNAQPVKAGAVDFLFNPYKKPGANSADDGC